LTAEEREIVAARFRFVGEIPIPDGARRALRRFLNAWFRFVKKRPEPD